VAGVVLFGIDSIPKKCVPSTATMQVQRDDRSANFSVPDEQVLSGAVRRHGLEIRFDPTCCGGGLKYY
jgi:hypothetical protein